MEDMFAVLAVKRNSNQKYEISFLWFICSFDKKYQQNTFRLLLFKSNGDFLRMCLWEEK